MAGRTRIETRSLLLVLLCSLVTATSGGSTAADESRSPDILLVTVDTLRADHLPMYGYGRDTAPDLAAWAADAVIFTNAHATSSWTVPSVASLMTGVAPPTHGVVQGSIVARGRVSQEALPAGLVTLAELLRDGGYATFAVTANGHLDRRFGFARGFEHFECPGFTATATEVNGVAAGWRSAIESADGPVFVWLHYFDPHYAYHRRDPWFSAYEPEATDQEIAVIRQVEHPWPRLPPEAMAAPDRYVTVGQALYDSEINFWDRHFHQLLESMPRLAAAARIFTSDHGEEFFDHGDLGHGNNLHRETMGIPLIVRGPGLESGGRRDVAVGLPDVASLILHWARVDQPDHWQGRWPVEDDGSRILLGFLERRSARHKQQAILQGRWKLLRDTDRERIRLYDLAADPRERQDLAAARPAEVARLVELLEASVAALPPPPTAPEPVEIAEEEREMLRQLGYLPEESEDQR